MHLKESIHKLNTGLCALIYKMPILSYSERTILETIINDNVPINFNTIFIDLPYYWKPGKIKPRIKWCDKMIKKYSV